MCTFLAKGRLGSTGLYSVLRTPWLWPLAQSSLSLIRILIPICLSFWSRRKWARVKMNFMRTFRHCHSWCSTTWIACPNFSSSFGQKHMSLMTMICTCSWRGLSLWSLIGKFKIPIWELSLLTFYYRLRRRKMFRKVMRRGIDFTRMCSL